RTIRSSDRELSNRRFGCLGYAIRFATVLIAPAAGCSLGMLGRTTGKRLMCNKRRIRAGAKTTDGVYAKEQSLLRPEIRLWAGRLRLGTSSRLSIIHTPPDG